ncbi:MAG: hypothetical protein QNI98_06215 [Woeseiaceae bacterium]|nr:hypothetical protein [Woeseiaceae bacterium]
MPYILVFKGELEPDVTREQAARAIAEYLGKPADRVERGLFRGKPVKIATVDTKEEARSYVAAFKAAGAKLEAHLPKPQAQPGPDPEATGTAAAPSNQPASRASSGRKVGLVAATVVCIVLIAGGAWYTSPVWMSGASSQDQLLISNALASEDVIILGHIDFERALQLQTRLFGARDKDALLSADRGWDGLVAAGVKPEDIDDVMIAFHGNEQSRGWALAVTGRFNADNVRAWISTRYNVDRVVGDTVYFNWVDDRTCELESMKAARILPDLVVIAEADRIDGLLARVDAQSPAEISIDDWLGRIEQQLLTIGVLRPTAIGQTASGIAGSILSGAGDAAEPASALYFGAEPTLMPPGVFLSGSIASTNAAFLERVHSSANDWLDEVRSKTADRPDVLDLVNRLAFSLESQEFTAGIRLDTDFDNEVQTLVGGIMQRSFGVSSGGSMQDQVNENPMQFSNTTASSLPSFDQFGDAFVEPQWQDGPFALSISRLSFNDSSAFEVALRGEGRGVPNAGGQAKLVRMRINDVTNAAGESLLPEFECGPNVSHEWAESNPTVQQSYFDSNNEIAYYPYLSMDKTFTFAEETNPDDVAAIRGEIEYQMPVEVRSIKLDMPVNGEVIETEDLRVMFRGGSDSSISYQVSGDSRRLLDVRALNANNAVLESGSSMSSSNWFGGGKDVSISIYGTIKAVELIVAEQVQTLSYNFEIASVYPANNSNFAVPFKTLDVARPDAVAASMRLDAPNVTFDWNAPITSVTAGPAFLALNSLEATSYAGLRTRFELYVPNTMPLADHLNGGTVYFEKATLADGSSMPLTMDAQLTLTPHGGYWSNGEYVPDPEKPWLDGQVDMQMIDYEAETPTAVDGRLVFRAPSETATVTLPALPGSSTAEYGIELLVSEWRPNSIGVDVKAGAERILSIVALDAENNLVGRATSIDGRYDGYETSISNLQAPPKSLQVLVATESTEYEVPFSVTMPQQDSLN